MQKQPRPHLRFSREAQFRERRVTTLGGKLVYLYSYKGIQTYFAEKQFPTYTNGFRSDGTVFPTNVSYRKYWWRRYPKVDWRTNPNIETVGFLSDRMPPTYLKNRPFVKDKCIQKCISELADARVDLLTAFAERQKTIKMVESRLKQAYYSLRALRKGDVNKAVRIIRNATGKKGEYKRKKTADAYLEWIYGWAPFLGDLSGLMEMKPPIPSQYIRTPFGLPYDYMEKISSDNPRTKADATHYYRGKDTCIINFELEMDIPALTSAAQLGLTNPMVTAWEIVPWSFVIDWFIPIGDWLQQFDIDTGWDIRKPCVTEKSRFMQHSTSTHHGSLDHHHHSVDRSTNLNLRTSRPYFKNPITPVHALNALALITSLKGGAPRDWGKFG